MKCVFLCWQQCRWRQRPRVYRLLLVEEAAGGADAFMQRR